MMRTIILLFTLLLSTLSSAQELKNFNIKDRKSSPESIIISPKDDIKYLPNTIRDSYTFKRNNDYFKRVNQIARKIFPFKDIPENRQNFIITQFFNYKGEITYCEILVFKKFFNYTTPEQWEAFFQELKSINLLPYVKLDKPSSNTYYMMGISVVNDAELEQRGITF